MNDRAVSTLHAVAAAAVLALLGASARGVRAEPPAPKPSEKLIALVVDSGEDRAALEAKASKLRRNPWPHLQLAAGYPKVLAAEQLHFQYLESDSYWLVAGVCPDDRGRVVARIAGTGKIAPLQRGPATCPTLLPGALAPALEDAIANRYDALAIDLLEHPVEPISEDLRVKLGTLAASRCAPEVLEKLMAGGRIDASAALAAAIACTSAATPPRSYAEEVPGDGAQGERVVRQLLAASASAKGHGDWIAVSLLHGRIGVAKLLVEAGADPRTAAAAVLAKAVDGPPEALAWALSFKLDPNATREGEPDPLHRAAAPRKQEHLRLLLQAGARADTRDQGGMTALDLLLLPGAKAPDEAAWGIVQARPAFLAAYAGDLKTLRDLPAAALDERWGGWTPLAVAAARGQDEAGLFLLEHGADASVVLAPGAAWGGHDVLTLAVSGGARRLALALIEKGAALETAVPACCAVRQEDGMVVVADAPLNSGDRPEPVSLRPLHRAARAGLVEVVEALLAKGVDANTTDGSGLGLTPVMLAAERGQTAVFKPLAAAKGRAALADASKHSGVAHAMASNDPGSVVLALQGAFGARVLDGAPGALSAAATSSAAEPELFQALLAAGAGHKGEGKRAVMIACKVGNEVAFDALEAAGYQSGRSFFPECVDP